MKQLNFPKAFKEFFNFTSKLGKLWELVNCWMTGWKYGISDKKNSFATLKKLKVHETFFGGIYRLALKIMCMMLSLILELLLFFSNRIM